jgi:hypothetical protein
MMVRSLAPFGWLLAGAFLTAAHCRKELPPCQSNCGMASIQGDVIDGSSGQSMKGQQVNAELKWKGYCIFGCTTYSVTSAETDASGHFILHADFDTTLLQQNSLNISVPIPNGYLISPWFFGPGVLFQPDKNNTMTFNNIDNPVLQNLQFVLYQQALLQLELKRTSLISSRWPQVNVSISFSNAKINTVFGFDQKAGNIDTTLSIYTAGNVYSTVGAYKTLPDSSEISVIDSLICVPGASNKIIINY